MRPPVIPIDEIPEEGKSLEFDLEAGWLREALEGTEFSPAGEPSGHASLRLDRRDRDVLLTGSVDASLATTCVRCLNEITVKVHADLALNLEPATAKAAPRRSGSPEEIELGANDLDADFYTDDRIDTGTWLREQLLVEAPSYPSCAEGCEPPAHAQTETRAKDVDPRFASIKNLLKNETKE